MAQHLTFCFTNTKASGMRWCFLFLLFVHGVQSQASISVDQECYAVGESIRLTFLNPNDDGDDWVAIYRHSIVDEDADLPSTSSLWMYTCGDQDCDEAVSRGTVTMSATADAADGIRWPLPVGTYVAILSNSESTPYQAVAMSRTFAVRSPSCSTFVAESELSEAGESEESEPSEEEESQDSEEQEDESEENESESEESLDSEDNDSEEELVMPNLSSVVREAREDIRDLIEDIPFLGPKFVRLAFHDCVGGCDGCVDMTNPDNAGLHLAIDALEDIVDRYERQGLSRTDIWMLSSMVGLDIAVPDNRITFPMRWMGRQTCAQIMDNNCGRNFLGESTTCGPSTGPNHELCAGDAGTTTILNFFRDEFDFDAKETVALMGAHSIGAMRAQNLGFEGTSGWDLTNDVLDQGYYIELVSFGDDDPVDDAPDWEFEVQRNGDRPNIPDRPQWTHTTDGTKLTMLHADICLARQLEEGVNLDDEGRPTCSFKGRNACPVARETMPHLQLYANNRELFLHDFRRVMTKMVEHRYRRGPVVCPLGEICRLQADF